MSLKDLLVKVNNDKDQPLPVAINSIQDPRTRFEIEGRGLFDRNLTYPPGFRFDGTPEKIAASGGSDGTGSGDTGLFVGQIQKGGGRMWFLESLLIYVTKPVQALITIKGTTNTGTNQLPHRFTTTLYPNMPPLTINKYVRDRENIIISLLGGISETGNIVLTVSPIGFDLTDDDDLQATSTKKIVFIGDSLTECSNIASIGSFSRIDMWNFMIYDYYRKKGYDVRWINTGRAGQTSTQAESVRLQGGYACVKDADLVFYMEGINDIGGSTWTNTIRDTYSYNLNKMIDYAILNMKSTGKFVALGSTPVGGTVKHTAAESLRAQTNTIVQQRNTSRVLYFNMGTAFDRTNNSFYYTTEPVGNEVHFNILGSNAIYNNIKTNFLDTIIPTI